MERALAEGAARAAQSGKVFADDLDVSVVGAAFVTTDIYVTATAAVSMLAFLQARQSSEVSTQRWWIRWMWCALGVGFLIKGPPVVLPLLARAVRNVPATTWPVQASSRSRTCTG